VPTDADGHALGPAILWMDRRGDALLAGMDAGVVRERCGLVLDATHMGGKIAWLDPHLPERARVRTWHQPVSFMVAALTGARVMGPSLASTTMLFELAARGWNEALAARFGVRREELPELAEETAVAGGLSAAGAALTGLPRGLPVAVGTGDDFANLIGCGIAAPGTAVVSLGTAEAIGVVSDRLLVDPRMLVETHVFPGSALHLGNPGWLSGGAVRWAMTLLSVPDDAAFMALAAEAPAGCDGLVFLPALSGAMAPKWIAAARGSFVGLGSSHGPAHMARAVLEGTAFAMRDVIDRMEALGVPVSRIRLVGGGARGRLWAQIPADLMGQQMEVLAAGEAAAMGAAAIAAVAGGRFATLAEAAGALRLEVAEVSPKLALKRRYDEAYRRYRQVFAALEPVWR
jgi:xylulokinase